MRATLLSANDRHRLVPVCVLCVHWIKWRATEVVMSVHGNIFSAALIDLYGILRSIFFSRFISIEKCITAVEIKQSFFSKRRHRRTKCNIIILPISAEAFWPISASSLSFLRGFLLLLPGNILWSVWLLAFGRSKLLIQNRPPLDDMPVWTLITYYFREMNFLNNITLPSTSRSSKAPPSL